MNATEAQAGFRPVQGSTTLKAIAGGAIMESIGAIATIALAIIGLAGVFSQLMACIATIVLGAAILIEGGTFASSYSRTLARQEGLSRSADWNEGLTVEFLGGLAGVVLGILALLGVATMTLLPIAVLVFGASFLLSGLGTVASAGQASIGLGVLVLGLLAVAGHISLTLVLVALVCLGASALFSGAWSGSKVAAAKS